MLSNLHQIMNRDDLKKPNVLAVPGVDGVFVREISGKEYRQFQSACSSSTATAEDKSAEAVYRFVNLTACREDGSRFYSDGELSLTEDLPIVRAKVIYAAAAELNGLVAAEKKST